MADPPSSTAGVILRSLNTAMKADETGIRIGAVYEQSFDCKEDATKREAEGGIYWNLPLSTGPGSQLLNRWI